MKRESGRKRLLPRRIVYALWTEERHLYVNP
jgi:hypothetical protein